MAQRYDATILPIDPHYSGEYMGFACPTDWCANGNGENLSGLDSPALLGAFKPDLRPAPPIEPEGDEIVVICDAKCQEKNRDKKKNSTLRTDLEKYNPNIKYCGGSSSMRLPNSVAGACYNEACYIHDICYTTSSGRNKHSCDIEFGINIATLMRLRNLETSVLIIPIADLTGTIGFLIVDLGGGFFYHKD